LTARSGARASDGERDVFAHLLFVAFAAALFAIAVEIPHYANALGFDAAPRARGDRFAVAWLLIAKSLLPLLPFQVLALLGARLGFGRTTRRLLTAATAVTAAWLALDVWLQSHYGAHLTNYLPFIGSALRSREQVQWVGDPVALAVALAKLFAATAIVCGALRALAVMATRAGFARLAPRPARALVLAACCAYLAIVLAAFPAQRLLAAPELRKRVAMSLPYGTDWSFSRAVAHASHDLHLLGLVPWPWRSAELTEVMIHNPASDPRSAEGWQLENASGQRATLHGEVPAGATRHFELERTRFALSRKQDSVTLAAPGGGVRSRVDYRDENVKRGAVLWNPIQSGDSEIALAQIGEVAQGAYADAFSRIVADRPATLVPAAQQPRADAPNVILLVVESFRHEVVRPALLARLAALGASGVLAPRHYSGSNSSHLGLFSLLYARLPLVYDVVLDGGRPPAAVELFRQLGYRSAFVSSGEIEAWKRMDQFLGERVFDRVILHTATRAPLWKQWPDCDRQTLDSIRRLASEPGPHFIVGFLMTTHFPYPYPEAFGRYGPVSHEDELPSWDQLFRAPLDREKLWNRYRNASLSLEAQLVDFAAGLDPARNVIAITGDHGESFGDDGALVHGSRASDAQTRVPLVVFGAGVEPTAITGPTSHMDVLPTLLHAATGVADPARGLDGRDLLASPTPREAIFVAPYKLTQPYDLLWIRDERRLLLRVRTDRPLLDAFAFVDDSGFPLLAPDPSLLADSEALAASLRGELTRLGGDEAAPAHANSR
jgi:hypothetical protein